MNNCNSNCITGTRSHSFAHMHMLSVCICIACTCAEKKSIKFTIHFENAILFTNYILKNFTNCIYGAKNHAHSHIHIYTNIIRLRMLCSEPGLANYTFSIFNVVLGWGTRRHAQLFVWYCMCVCVCVGLYSSVCACLGVCMCVCVCMELKPTHIVRHL